MQQELIKKKREIINTFLKKGVLISSKLLEEINDYDNFSRVFDTLKSKLTQDSAVVDLGLTKLIDEIKEEKTDIKKDTQQKEKVKVIYSYKEDPKKREPQDFVDHFNNRYSAIEKILKQRQEFNNTISINKLTNKTEKESVVIIGIVSSKHTTKNGNLLLILEDPTGQIKIIVNKNKPRLFNEAKDIVLDEILGVVGVSVNNVVFVNNIVWPDTPTNKELKKSGEEEYVLFLSDLHVGSSNFLPDDFEKFLRWINGDIGNEQQRHIAKNIGYIFIAGDLIDGCGIYPGQDKELIIKDVYQQYKECADLLKQIPSHIPLIICPGNHDALRIAEPQPPLSKKLC